MSTDLEIDFGLDDILPETDSPAPDPAHNLDDWAAQQLSKPPSQGFAAFDIETSPQSDEALRKLYTEPTFEEFAESCDRRWKPDTVAAKYKEQEGKGFEAFRDRAALSPLTGRVVAIGWTADNLCQPQIIGSNVVCDATEKPMLVDFWELLKGWLDSKLTIVTHNGFGFDLPFLIMRSRYHNIDIPVDLMRSTGRYVNWNPLLIDTMQVVAFGDGRRFTKLDALAKFFGVGGKIEGVSGKDFHKLWQSDHAKACEYLRNDVAITAAVAKKLAVV